jgi:Transposase IS66 family
VAWHVPDRCGGCGADLAGAPLAGVEARQVFDLPPLGLRSPSTGPAPVGDDPGRLPRARVRCGLLGARDAGAGVRLWVHQHLPVDRAAQLLADVLGEPLATGTLARVVTEGAAGLGGFAQVVCGGLAAAPVAHFVETGARMAGRLHWVHAASTGLLTLFTVHAKRGTVAVDAAGVPAGFVGWRSMTAGRRTRATRMSATRCAARTCSVSWRRSPRSPGGAGRLAWPSCWWTPSWSLIGPARRCLSGGGRSPGSAAYPV